MSNLVFLSWSGAQSRELAKVFKEYLHLIVPGSDTFMSEEDISKGARGINEIETKLENAAFGIVFVTKDNREKPWINYEAGAIAKGLGSSKVSPVLLDIGIGELGASPLSQFQATKLEKIELTKLFISIAESVGVRTENVNAYMDKFFPDLEGLINKIKSKTTEIKESQPSADEVLLQGMAAQLNFIRTKLLDPTRILPEEYLAEVFGKLGEEGKLAKLLTKKISDLSETNAALIAEIEDIIFDLDFGLIGQFEGVLENLTKSEKFQSEFEKELKSLRSAIDSLNDIHGSLEATVIFNAT